MGRKERRAAQKAQQIQNKADELWIERRKRWREKEIIDHALKEHHEASVHQCTGEIYTMMALILRQPPYRWSVEKIMRHLERIQSGIMMIDSGEYSVKQLTEDAEAWGFRLKWSAKGDRKFISDLGPFEELENEEQYQGQGES